MATETANGNVSDRIEILVAAVTIENGSPGIYHMRIGILVSALITAQIEVNVAQSVGVGVEVEDEAET